MVVVRIALSGDKIDSDYMQSVALGFLPAGTKPSVSEVAASGRRPAQNGRGGDSQEKRESRRSEWPRGQEINGDPSEERPDETRVDPGNHGPHDGGDEDEVWLCPTDPEVGRDCRLKRGNCDRA